MQRLLIVGCGDVARRLIPRLTGRFRVFCLVRSAEDAGALRALGCVPLVGDLDVPATLVRAARVARAVMHFAPPPLHGSTDPRTRRLLAAFGKAGSLPRRLVYVSTTGVYGDRAGAPTPETAPARPATARARRRVDAERQLRRYARRSGAVVCLLRAPGIYAADRLPLERLRRGDPALLPAEDVYTNHIHADDLGGLALAALRFGRPGRAYNAVDDSALRMGDYFDAVAAATGLPRPPRMGRAALAERLSPAMLSFMGESRRLTNTRMGRELRYRLRYPTVGDGLAAVRAAGAVAFSTFDPQSGR